ncbi:SEL1-like repeat protein [Oxalobacter vibrioformis]|uniref:SEL1-like repeat protein n=1 Tax=Oxalobacter vibrioformis TaxID=933080 RepID=A0A9E9P464_9BURK|nr:SEL1-like repeat protein [Oxalobacter vibrioformis]WAW09796.1 SEL1-like repeat protein [Oxalobacter vibrioformis]
MPMTPPLFDMRQRQESAVLLQDGQKSGWCCSKQWFRNTILMVSFLACSSWGGAEETGLNAQQYLSRLPEIQKEAEAGNVSEQSRLAILYMAGIEGKPDYKNGSYWLKKAAKQDSVFAETLLAFMYVEGLGVPQDFDEAVHWAHKSAAYNNYAGQLIMGALYEAGAGVTQSDKKAAEWYEKSAQYEKDMGARYKLGMMYLEGRGVEKNIRTAENWLMRGAEKGDAHACYQLGMMHYEGKGVAQDYFLALDWFGRAAAIGIPEKSRILKEIFWDVYVPGEEYSKTIGLFMKRDPLVKANANYMLGNMCETGTGIEKDLEKARFYYTRAADEGHVEAKMRLNVLSGKTVPETARSQPAPSKNQSGEKSATSAGPDTAPQ